MDTAVTFTASSISLWRTSISFDAEAFIEFAGVQVYDITPSPSVGGAARFAAKVRCMLDCFAWRPAAVDMPPKQATSYIPLCSIRSRSLQLRSQPSFCSQAMPSTPPCCPL